MPSPEPQTALPLVSVIIRSMDRAVLGEALASLARQTCDKVEVVLVNAKGGQHGAVGEHCERFPLRLVNQGGSPLSRPQAANAGLDAALGEYLAFLDDDDTLDPDHLSALLAVLQAQADVSVAYAGVRCMERGDSDQKISRIFGEPLHSTSGVSPQAPDMDAVRRATRALFAKWMRLTPDDFKKICDLYHSASAEVQKNHAEIALLQDLLQEIRSSTSWRVTAPLRWVKTRLKKSF